MNLQGILNILSDWCNKWGIKITLAKPNAFISGTKENSVQFSTLRLENLHLAMHTSINTLASGLRQLRVLTKVYDHANRALGIIAKSKSAGGLPMKVFSHLFNTLVLSRIEYTAAIWVCRSFFYLIKSNIMHCFFVD